MQDLKRLRLESQLPSVKKHKSSPNDSPSSPTLGQLDVEMLDSSAHVDADDDEDQSSLEVSVLLQLASFFP